MTKTLSERETHFNIVADSRSECEIFTDDPVWRGRLEKWFLPYHTSGDGAWFRVPTKTVIRESALVGGTDYLRDAVGRRSVQNTEAAAPETVR